MDSKAGPAGFAKAKEVGGAPFNKSVSMARARIRATLISRVKTSRISVPPRGSSARRPLPMRFK